MKFTDRAVISLRDEYSFSKAEWKVLFAIAANYPHPKNRKLLMESIPQVSYSRGISALQFLKEIGFVSEDNFQIRFNKMYIEMED